MTEDRHGSRPWQIGARSNSFAVVFLTMAISAFVALRSSSQENLT